MSGSELLVIGLAILLLFGGKQLPTLLRTWGRLMGEIRRTMNQIKRDAGLDVVDDIRNPGKYINKKDGEKHGKS